MEELAEKIEKIFKQFIDEELGNRLSQFAWASFSNIVLNEIKNYKEGKKDGLSIKKD